MSVLALGLLSWTPVSAEETGLPVIEGRATLAVVNGEPITVDAFFRDLVAMHDGTDPKAVQRSRQKPEELLDRLVNIRLILQEASNIGLDELPQVRAAVDAYRRDAMKQMLYRQHAETVTAVDPQEVEAKYRAEVEELQVRSLMIAKRADAVELVSRLEQGEEFASLAAESVEAGKAEAGDDAEYLPTSKLLPVVREAVSTMEIGEISPPIDIGEQLAMVQLLGRRFPEDPEKRSMFEDQALRRKRAESVRIYVESLVDKHATRDETLLEALDFEAKEPGFDVMLQDDRILAEVEGQGTVRVKDLAQSIKEEFFHGMEAAISGKRVNPRKVPLLNRSLQSMAVLREAKQSKLDLSEEYLTTVEEYRNGILFQVFLEKVVEPEIRLNDEELKAYRDEHLDEFSSPEMMRVDELVFDLREAAERALAGLLEGADFQWTKANASGQIDLDSKPDRMQFPAMLVVTAAFPDDVREIVSGARPGEFRLYAPEDGPYYVLRIREVVSPNPAPFEQIKQSLVRGVYGEKRKEVLEDWMEKLRAASEIEVFATAEQLRRMLGDKMAQGEPS